MGYINDLYTHEQTSPTMTDRYHFTTGFGYFVEGRFMNKAVSNITIRKNPQGSGWTAEAGIEAIIDTVKRWKDYGLTAEDKTWMYEQGYPKDFINYLHDVLINDCPIQIDVSKKRIFFPQEPVVRLVGPIGIIKMLESINLSHENGQNAYATHAARLIEVLEAEVESGAPKGEASVQGLRRGPGLGAAIEASRGLAAGGYQSTSTGRAAEMLGLKFVGTMDHAWIMTHKYQLNKEDNAPTMRDLFIMEREGRFDELREALSKDAFRSYAYTNREKGIFLTDTYDTPEGIDDAITVTKEMRACAIEFNQPDYGKYYGMRFDSGDLVAFSKLALRKIASRSEGDLLDALPNDADLKNYNHKDLMQIAEKSSASPFCAASDGIDVYSTQDIRRRGGWFKFFGVGTAGSHPPPLGAVQKVSAMYMDVLNWDNMPENADLTPTMKINKTAPAKSSNPGMLNSRRFYGNDGKLSHIVLYDEISGFDENNKIVNLRDFLDIKVNDNQNDFEDILEPVFDEKGQYVYKGLPQKPVHKGSHYMITDLEQHAHTIRKELDLLPDDVRKVQRPRDAVLTETLVRKFKEALENGEKELNLNIEEIENSLPEEQAQIPIYIDMNLFKLRQICENRHGIENNAGGVQQYIERFER